MILPVSVQQLNMPANVRTQTNTFSVNFDVEEHGTMEMRTCLAIHTYIYAKLDRQVDS